MKGATGFMFGAIAGAACVLLVLRIREMAESGEGIDELSGKVTEQLAELEQRAAAVAEAVMA